jgi:hypothetical protein
MRRFLYGVIVGAVAVGATWWLNYRVRRWDDEENMQ